MVLSLNPRKEHQQQRRHSAVNGRTFYYISMYTGNRRHSDDGRSSKIPFDAHTSTSNGAEWVTTY